MERVAFLIEESGIRIPCLLNPETLVLRRWAGLRQLRHGRGTLTGSNSTDDPVVWTGGGATELRLDLLFDVGLDLATPRADDVRALTKPLWDLTENLSAMDGSSRPPVIRFVWGKAWNIRSVVAAIAERLELFDALGNPGRSWLRMRLLRVSESAAPEGGSDHERLGGIPIPISPEAPGPEPIDIQEILPAPEGEAGADPRLLPELAFRYLENPGQWRWIASASGVDDPLNVEPGTQLRIPKAQGSKRA